MATYDPKKIVMTFGGAIITGFADGVGINAERVADDWSMSTGMDNATAYTKINNTSGTLVITLQQTSLSNNDLTTFLELDRTANLGLLPYLMKDLLSTTQVSGTGRIMKPPAIGFANDVSTREWTIACDEMLITVGGNL